MRNLEVDEFFEKEHSMKEGECTYYLFMQNFQEKVLSFIPVEHQGDGSLD